MSASQPKFAVVTTLLSQLIQSWLTKKLEVTYQIVKEQGIHSRAFPLLDKPWNKKSHPRNALGSGCFPAETGHNHTRLVQSVNGSKMRFLKSLGAEGRPNRPRRSNLTRSRCLSLRLDAKQHFDVVQNQLYFTMHHSARKPSFQPIFLPSRFVRPLYEIATSSKRSGWPLCRYRASFAVISGSKPKRFS